DLVFDCRFLPNPHWVDDLRPLSGLDDPIQEYVLNRDLTTAFLDHLTAMLDDLIPAFDGEGKSYLTIAFGCTGGRHRSVAVAEAVGRILSERGWQSRVSHRDINRP
ncbi:MAG: RapZ C-terminal domain-containing protein, partial [Acidimicrobiales bacterium]